MVRSFPSFPHGLTFLSKRLVPNLKWTIENGLPIVVTIVYESISFHFSTFSNIINEAACREKLVSCRWFWIGQVTKAALTRRILGGTTQTFIWLPYPVREEKTLPGFRIRELKENGHFFLVVPRRRRGVWSSSCKPWWIDDFYTRGVREPPHRAASLPTWCGEGRHVCR